MTILIAFIGMVLPIVGFFLVELFIERRFN